MTGTSISLSKCLTGQSSCGNRG